MPASTIHTRPSVLILGAGLAGLTAAYELQKKHIPVTLIEAKNRVGGRIASHTIDRSSNLIVEDGAEWVGRSHQRMHALVHAFNLKLIDHHLNSHLIMNGHHFPPGQWEISLSTRLKLRELLNKFAQLTPEQAASFDDVDLWHFLHSQLIHGRDIELLSLLIEGDYGESIRFLSTQFILHDSVLGDYKGLTDYYRIEGGNSRLVEAMLKMIGPEHLYLERPVRSIIQTETGVEVTAENGERWNADYLICTLPAPVVNNLNWHPQLPESLNKNLATLQYSRIAKVSLLFSQRFWQDEDFEVITDTLPYYIFHATQNQPGTKGALTAYATGDRAYVLAHASPDEQADFVCGALKPAFGYSRHLVETVHCAYWTEDKYAGGAFAVFSPGQFAHAQENLQKEFNRVFFAGEHTATYQGFMEGATESGEYAAHKIIDLLIRD